MNVLLVCHAGLGVGLGHLARELVAARALNARLGARVRLLIQGDGVDWKDLSDIPHHFIGAHESLSRWIGAAQAEHGFDVVLFDLHPRRVPEDFSDLLSALGAAGCKRVSVDGLLAHRPQLDLIFTPSFHFAPPPDLKDGAPIVFGWDCFLLNVREAPRDWQPGNRVLALTGGSDATGLGQTWPSLLDDTLPPHVELHWVTGPFSMPPCWPEAPRIRLQKHQAPAGLGPLMQASHYAVTVFGVSFFELLYLGIPTVVFSPYGDKDNLELDGVARSGAALVARDEREATRRLTDLMHDDALARQLSQRARALLGARGADRLCAEIAALMPTVP